MIHETALVHEEADIHPSAEIGALTRVWANAGVLADCRIGAGVSIGRGAEIGRGSRIGDKTRIGWNCFLPPNSTVGESVFIGPGTICCDDKYPEVPAEAGAPYNALPPTIGDHASIGAGVILMPGVKIGAHARIAGGAIVTKDVPDHGSVKGQAAKPFRVPFEWGGPPVPTITGNPSWSPSDWIL